MDEDPIIEEIPVFYSQKLEGNLSLFQYPTKMLTANLGTDIVNCQFKPQSQVVKIHFDNGDPSYLDSFRMSELGTCPNENMKAGENCDKLSSKYSLTFASNSYRTNSYYLAGVFVDNNIYFTVLNGIYRMRHSFPYMDKYEKRSKIESRNSGDEELQQVRVKFLRPNLHNEKLREKQRYVSHLKQLKDERWYTLNWRQNKTQYALKEKKCLHSASGTCVEISNFSEVNHFKVCMENLFLAHIGKMSTLRLEDTRKSRILTFKEQLVILLTNVKMATFDEIFSYIRLYINRNISKKNMLAALEEIGLIIHGNWVLQSELLFPPGTFSECNGISSELMVRARNYILYKLYRTQTFYRHQVLAAMQLPSEEANLILSSVSRMNEEKKWEMLLPINKEFIESYPELVKRQELIWRTTENKYIEMDQERSTRRLRKRSIRDRLNHGPLETTINLT